MSGAFGLKYGYKVDEKTGEFTHWINTAEGLEMAKYINRFVREGLMDPDFLSNDFEIWKTKVMNDRVVGNIGTWWHSWVAGHEAWAQIEGNDYNVNKRFTNVSIKDSSAQNHTLLGSNFLGSTRVIITDKCKQPENIIKWLNWEYSELGTMITGFGEPSSENVWDINDGEWMFKDNTFDNRTVNENFHAVVEKFGAKSFWLGTSGGLLEDEHMDPRVTKVTTYGFVPIKENGEFFDPGSQICWQFYDSTPWDSTFYAPVFKSEDSITIVNQTIKESILTEWAKIVTSKSESDLEKQFSESQDKLNSLGLKELEAYYSESYKNNVDKFNGK